VLGTAPAHHVLDHWGIPVTPPPATLEPPRTRVLHGCSARR
jgi:hypothetical protein